MDCGRCRMRMNLEGDRLSSLSDDLIHKILSSVGTKQAIETSGLSSRWRFIWTSMPYLNFSTDDFPTLPEFSKFVADVLSHRNNLIDVYSLKLKFRGKATQLFIKNIMDYAFSHNIQQLNVVCLLENHTEFPLSLFNSLSLKHLTLTAMNCKEHGFFIAPTSTWELPALTTLELHDVILCDDEAEECVGVFLKCANLQNLILKRFFAKGSNGFSIVHPQLSNLTLIEGSRYEIFNVSAPQLKSLTIRHSDAEHVISAPNLASLIYKGKYRLHLSTDGFHSLEKADICVSSLYHDAGQKIVDLLQHIPNVRFLTLNLSIVKVLSKSKDLILQQPSPFVNLKNLKIYPEINDYWGKTSKNEPKYVMSAKVKRYLLDGSSRNNLTMVLDEEIEARKIMAELGVILEKENKNAKSKKKQKNEGNVAPLNSRHWNNLNVQIQKASLIVSKVQSIKELVSMLPAYDRAKIQPRFSSLCAESNIAVSQITDRVKTQCHKVQSGSSVCLHEPATILEPSS